MREQRLLSVVQPRIGFLFVGVSLNLKNETERRGIAAKDDGVRTRLYTVRVHEFVWHHPRGGG